MEKHYRITVQGKVQGVFYRASTESKAKSMGIKGTVRNLPDGSVEIYAQGHEETLDEFIQWCWKGPEAAIVDNVSVEEQELEDYSDFSVTA